MTFLITHLWKSRCFCYCVFIIVYPLKIAKSIPVVVAAHIHSSATLPLFPSTSKLNIEIMRAHFIARKFPSVHVVYVFWIYIYLCCWFGTHLIKSSTTNIFLLDTHKQTQTYLHSHSQTPTHKQFMFLTLCAIERILKYLSMLLRRRIVGQTIES